MTRVVETESTLPSRPVSLGPNLSPEDPGVGDVDVSRVGRGVGRDLETQ